MVFYIEACESGSMFYNKLKKNIDGMSIYCFLFIHVWQSIKSFLQAKKLIMPALTVSVSELLHVSTQNYVGKNQYCYSP